MQNGLKGSSGRASRSWHQLRNLDSERGDGPGVMLLAAVLSKKVAQLEEEVFDPGSQMLLRSVLGTKSVLASQPHSKSIYCAMGVIPAFYSTVSNFTA